MNDKIKKPLLIFDGDCNFCRRWVTRWKYLTADKVEYEPYQTAAERFPQIPREKFQAAVQLAETDGAVFAGAEAVFRTLDYAPGMGWWLWMYRRLPGFAGVSEWFYSTVARHRTLFSRLTSLLWGDYFERPQYEMVRWIFLRAMGIIYAIAFVSLGTQIIGLVGADGILPAKNLLELVGEKIGTERYWSFPTLCWLNVSDSFLRFLCWGGAGISVLLVLDFAPALMLILAWFFYLSLITVCREFLWFQWDILLLETGFLAIFFAPWKILPGLSKGAETPRAVLWLFRWLLFRLMFQSGCVKLLSGDETWRSMSALQFHYETQPIPNRVSWYAHQLPAGFHTFSVGVMFAVELFLPFLFFLPRRLRLFACAGNVLLQLLIIVTGNYCFFNWLTLALCLLLLDDALLTSVTPRRWQNVAKNKIGSVQKTVFTLAGSLIFVLGAAQLFGTFRERREPAWKIQEWIAPYHLSNSYGLFAVMTVNRPEIVIAGSADAENWLEYEFKWKPGDLKRAPEFVAPHQPRLDWQMWFAALGDYRNNQWFVNFMVRILQGKPDVTALMAKNPFPDAPPKYVRALSYDYHFTDAKTRRADGSWWRRELKGLYCPVLQLK